MPDLFVEPRMKRYFDANNPDCSKEALEMYKDPKKRTMVAHSVLYSLVCIMFGLPVLAVQESGFVSCTCNMEILKVWRWQWLSCPGKVPKILFVVVGTMKSVWERKRSGMSILAATYTSQCQTASMQNPCMWSLGMWSCLKILLWTKGNDQELAGVGPTTRPASA